MIVAVKRAAIAALVTLIYAGAATAEIRDYEFQLVDGQVKKGAGAIVAVRLIDKRTGRAVPHAVIVTKRIDMSPDGMPTMTSPLEQLTATEPGVYRFRTDIPMEGGWQLSLAAKVQGELGTLESRLILRAIK